MHKLRSNDKFYLQLLKIAYGIFLTYSLIGHIPLFSSILKATTFFAIGILIFNFFLQYNVCTTTELFGYIFLMAISLIHSYYSGNYGFFKLMLFAGSMRKIYLKDVIKFDMYLRIVLISIVVILCKVGIAPDVTHAYNGIIRHSLGFTNPNTLGIAVFVLVCDIFYVANIKLNFKLTIVVTGISLWLYSVARCRTAVYAIIALMIVALVYRYRPHFFETRIFRIAFYIMPIVLSLVTLVVVRSYMQYQEMGLQINDFLSGRVRSIARFVKLLSPTFWGQPIHETLDKTLDNTYAFILYDLGILVFTLFIIFYIRLIRKNISYKNIPLCIIMFAFMVYGLTEHLWINIDYNIFMLAFCYNPALAQRDNDTKIEMNNAYCQKYNNH